MKNTIYEQIKAQDKISFDELFQKNSNEFSQKSELGSILRILESENLVFQYSNQYYDLSNFENTTGFIQWNLNGFCWLSDTNKANEWGITFNPSSSLNSNSTLSEIIELPIYNKKKAHFGHQAEAKIIQLEDRTFIYILNSKPVQETKLIAVYQKPKNEWVILNSGTNFTFKNKLDNISSGEVSVFSSIDNKFLYNLGNIEEFGIESKIIQLLGEIKEAPHSDFTTSNENNNFIFLDKPFYTIDSLYTKDIDDAIWIEKKDNNYKLWVAIADVSSYVLPHDEQDLHAQEACSTTYLSHKTVHMLDRKLAEDFCSLNVGQLKQVLVCEMDITEDGLLLNQTFYNAHIKTNFRLTYSDVNKILNYENPTESFIFEGGEVKPFEYFNQNDSLLKSLYLLQKFSEINIQENRAFGMIEQPEIHLGSDGKINYLSPKLPSTVSEIMVEKAMFSANNAAAKFIYEKYPEFGMFRNQLAPEEGKFPKPAFYNMKNSGHWGLNIEFYTHFTSPIRRYCDLIVHRLIKGIIYDLDKEYLNDNLNKISEQINVQQYKSKQFYNKTKNLLLPQYIEKLNNQKLLSNKFNIADINKNGVVVINNQLIEVFIPLFKLDKSLLKDISPIIENEKFEEISLEDKKEIVNKLNKSWKLTLYIDDFTWTDERKNIFIRCYPKDYHAEKSTTIKLTK